MNVERTMEFILEQQAQQAAREARQDRRIDAITKLIQVGMKMLVKMEKNMEERDRVTDQKIQALGKRIDRLVAGLQRASGNGG